MIWPNWYQFSRQNYLVSKFSCLQTIPIAQKSKNSHSLHFASLLEKVQFFFFPSLTVFKIKRALYEKDSFCQTIDIGGILIWLLKQTRKDLTVRLMLFAFVWIRMRWWWHWRTRDVRHVLLRLVMMMLMTRRLSPTLCFHLKIMSNELSNFQDFTTSGHTAEWSHCQADGLHSTA